MALIRANAAGQVIQVLRARHETEGVSTPPGVAHSLPFDDGSNMLLVDDLSRNPHQYTLQTGVLRKDGDIVTPVADSQAKQDRDGLLNGAAQAVQGNLDFLAIGSPSNAQTLAQVRELTRQNNRVIKRLIQFTRES